MSHPDPSLIFQALNGFHQTEAIKAAIELELFTNIAAGATTAAAIGQKCGTPERTTRILCDYLVVQGFLTKSGSIYGLSPTAATFLVKGSHAYMGDMAKFVTHDYLRNAFHDLAGTVRRGGGDPKGMLEPNHPAWVEFARWMTGFLSLVADMTAKHVAKPGQSQKVLDIAAGHGMFGLMVAKMNPKAEIYAVDWAPVLAVAGENAQKMGCTAQYHTIPGSAFDVDLGSGYDLVLVPNFLHHFDTATCTKFLKRAKSVTKDGGTVAVVEFVPNDDRVSPPDAARFALQMLATPAGDAYTFAELNTMLSDAGFKNARAEALAPSPATLITATT